MNEFLGVTMQIRCSSWKSVYTYIFYLELLCRYTGQIQRNLMSNHILNLNKCVKGKDDIYHLSRDILNGWIGWMDIKNHILIRFTVWKESGSNHIYSVKRMWFWSGLQCEKKVISSVKGKWLIGDLKIYIRWADTSSTTSK